MSPSFLGPITVVDEELVDVFYDEPFVSYAMRFGLCSVFARKMNSIDLERLVLKKLASLPDLPNI